MALYGADGAVLDGEAQRWEEGFLVHPLPDHRRRDQRGAAQRHRRAHAGPTARRLSPATDVPRRPARSRASPALVQRQVAAQVAGERCPWPFWLRFSAWVARSYFCDKGKPLARGDAKLRDSLSEPGCRNGVVIDHFREGRPPRRPREDDVGQMGRTRTRAVAGTRAGRAGCCARRGAGRHRGGWLSLPAGAAGILPPNNPPSNIAPSSSGLPHVDRLGPGPGGRRPHGHLRGDAVEPARSRAGVHRRQRRTDRPGPSAISVHDVPAQRRCAARSGCRRRPGFPTSI